MARYMIPCLLGLEKLVGDEVKRLGLKNVRVENGRSEEHTSELQSRI